MPTSTNDEYRPSPSRSVSGVASMTGLEILDAMIEGHIEAPKFVATTGITLVSADAGEAVFEGIPLDRFTNPMGSVHGGWIATILDSAMGSAVHTRLEAGQSYTTLEMKLNIVKKLLPNSGPVRCAGTIVHLGSRSATAEAALFDASGLLIAKALSTCLILDGRSAGPRGARARE